MIGVLSLSILLFPVAASASPLPSDATVPVVTTSHPRLVMDSARVEAVKQSTDVSTARMRKNLIARANSFLSAPVIKYSLTNGRLLTVSSTAVDHAYNLAGAYLITGNTRYTDRLWQDIDAAAAFPNWNPNTFLDTGIMAHAFAVAYDWGYGAWTVDQKKILQKAITTMALQPAQIAYNLAPTATSPYANDPHWPILTNNRNVIINSGIGMAALAIAGEVDDPIVAEIIKDSASSITNGIREYGTDGGYSEGPTYWAWATPQLAAYLTSLRITTGTDNGLGQSAGLRETPSFGAAIVSPTGNAAAFSDGASGPAPFETVGADAAIAAITDNSTLDAVTAENPSTAENPRRLFWHVPGRSTATEPAAATLPRDQDFPGAAWAAMRENWNDPFATYASYRYGSTQNIDHQHEDAGSFSLTALGEDWAIDLGREDQSYVGDNGDAPVRSLYYRVRAEGHNTMDFDVTKDNYDSSGQPTRLASGANAASSFIVEDLSAMYPTAITSWRRGIRLTDDRQQVVVQDEFAARGSTSAQWRMQTGAAVSLSDDGRTAYLTQDDRLLEAQITSDTGTFSVMPASPLPLSPNPTQTPNTGYSVLAIQVEADAHPSRLTVQFTPIPDGRTLGVAKLPVTTLADWTVDPAPAAELTGLALDGVDLRQFDPGTLHYTVACSGSAAPQVRARAADGTTVSVSQATSVPGTATILANSSRGTASYVVDFVAKQPSPPAVPDPVRDFTVATDAIAPLTPQQSIQVTPRVSGTPSSPQVTYATSDPSVASIDGSGNLTAVAAGQAIIGVSVRSGGLVRYASTTVVVEDDTRLRIKPTATTYVAGGSSSTTSYGSTASLLIKGPYTTSATDGTGVRYSFLQFKLPTVPQGARVVGATLNLTGSITDNGYANSVVRVDARVVTGVLDTGAVSYSTRPTVSGSIVGSGTFGRAVATQQIDITSAVVSAVGSATPTLGLQLSEDTPNIGAPALVSAIGVAGSSPPSVDLVLQDANVPIAAASATSTRRGAAMSTINSDPSVGWEAWSPAALTLTQQSSSYAGAVDVTWGPTSSAERNLIIESSTDGSTWQKRFSGLSGSPNSTVEYSLGSAPASSAIRIRTTNGGVVGIKQLRIFPQPAQRPSPTQYLNQVQWLNLPSTLSVGSPTGPASLSSFDSTGKQMTNLSYSFASKDPTIATVAADGTVTPVAGGSTTITVTAVDPGTGNSFIEPFSVTVLGPTTLRVPIPDNAYVQGGTSASTALGAANGLQVKGPVKSIPSDGSGIRYTYLKLTVPAIPSSAHLTSAVLNIRGAIFDSGTGATAQVDAHEVTSALDPATVTYSSRPTVSASSAGLGTFTRTNTYQQIDVSNLVIARATDQTTTISIALSEDTPSTGSPLLVGLTSASSTTPPYLTLVIDTRGRT